MIWSWIREERERRRHSRVMWASQRFYAALLSGDLESARGELDFLKADAEPYQLEACARMLADQEARLQ